MLINVSGENILVMFGLNMWFIICLLYTSSAVTAACMMVKRRAYDEAGGLSEKLQVAFNDIDFCLKLQRAGYLAVSYTHLDVYKRQGSGIKSHTGASGSG